MTLAFHAAPPPGEWFNDPNALIFDGGEYRLFVQHRSDTPAFRSTGWARLSSADLLDWRCDGVVMPADGDAWRYSGSVVAADGMLEAFHTVHDAATGLEAQHVAVSGDGGATWRDTAGELTGPPMRNCRDPFVFADGAGWAMLLTETCDWTDWPSEPPARLRLYRSEDRRSWRLAGCIGPWSPPGVMWEVPVLMRVDGVDLLCVSQVDRREDGASCSVRAWAGALGEDGFAVAAGWPVEGERVDLGPDFYALMAAGFDAGVAVAWASSWQTARVVAWPGFAGGPISLPRRVGVEERGGRLRLTHRPLDAAVAAFAWRVDGVPAAGMGTASFEGGAAFALTVAVDGMEVRLTGDPAVGGIALERDAPPPFGWHASYAEVLSPCATREVRIFVDGPVVEIFVSDGIAATFVLPTREGVMTATITAVADVPIVWSTRAGN